MRKPILIAAMVALSALMLVAAGCGGSKSADATTTVAQTQAAQTDAATTEATSTESMTTSTESMTTGSTDTTKSTGKSTADCQEFATAISDVGTQFSQALSGAGNTDISKAASAFDAMAQKAPDAVKADFQTIDNAFKKMAVVLKGVDLSGGKTPDAATLQKLQKLGTEIDQTALTNAETNISKWVTANC